MEGVRMDNLFDLNIEKVLEHWGVEHAIREIIANALDEMTLTGTKKIEISYSDGVCHIRDYGRGLQYIHFTQNENKEKAKRLCFSEYGIRRTYSKKSVDFIFMSLGQKFGKSMDMLLSIGRKEIKG